MVPEASGTALKCQGEALPGPWATESGTWQGTPLVRGGSRVAQKQMSNEEDPEANGKTDGKLWVLLLTLPLTPDDLGLGAFPLCALVLILLYEMKQLADTVL